MRSDNYRMYLEYLKQNLKTLKYSKLEMMLIDRLLDKKSLRNLNEIFNQLKLFDKTLYSANINYNGNDAKLLVTDSLTCLKANDLSYFKKVIPLISSLNNSKPSLLINNDNKDSIIWTKNEDTFNNIIYLADSNEKNIKILHIDN